MKQKEEEVESEILKELLSILLSNCGISWTRLCAPPDLILT